MPYDAGTNKGYSQQQRIITKAVKASTLNAYIKGKCLLFIYIYIYRQYHTRSTYAINVSTT